MTVIAMTRELGSLGQDVAAAVATQLNLHIIHHERFEHNLAERLGAKGSAVHRYLEGEANLLERWRIDRHKLSRCTTEEVLEQAVRGDVVIRGWGGISLLRSVPHVLRVRVCAPLTIRIERLMERIGLSDPGVARREIERSDAAEARTVEDMFGGDWRSAELHHIVLNTEHLSSAACASQLSTLAQDDGFRETDTSKQLLDDLLVTTRVQIALERVFGMHHHIAVMIEDGEVVLTGMAGSGDVALQAAGIARGVKGVRHVTHTMVETRPSQDSRSSFGGRLPWKAT